MKRLVIGATNEDHSFSLKAPLRMADSNPVKDAITLGGVGYNIAHHLLALDKDAQFITAFNRPLDDPRITTIKTNQAPSYYAVMESDMMVAFASMDVLETLEASPFLSAIKSLKEDDILACDLNFPESTLNTIFQVAKAPVWVDATSAHKVKKLHSLSPFVYGVKLNQMEASVYTGEQDLEPIISALEKSKIPEIVLTLGAKGVIHIKDEVIHFKDEAPFDAVHLSGVGDAFMAGVLLAEDEPSFDTAFALAAFTAKHEGATPPLYAYHSLNQERKNRHVSIQKRRPRRP